MKFDADIHKEGNLLLSNRCDSLYGRKARLVILFSDEISTQS